MRTVVKLVVEDGNGNRLAEEPLRQPWRRSDKGIDRCHGMIRDAITQALRGALLVDLNRMLERLADQMAAKAPTLAKDAES